MQTLYHGNKLKVKPQQMPEICYYKTLKNNLNNVSAFIENKQLQMHANSVLRKK